MKNIILLGTKGIPARHGAYEQFAQVFAEKNYNKYNIIIFGEGKVKAETELAVKVISIPKLNIPGYPIIYDLTSILISIFRFSKSNTSILIFGYTASPFFFLLNIVGFNYWVNTDGYEYRRGKFGTLAKVYLRVAEKFAVLFAGKKLITDSSDLVNYFNQRYGVEPKLIAYGYDEISKRISLTPRPINQDYDLCIQRLEPENNISMIVEGYRGVKRTLVIIGPTTSWFDKNIKPHLPDNVIYLGPVYERSKLENWRYHAAYYIHGHSVGGMNPVLIESLQYPHLTIAYLTPHNHEVYGNGAYYFYESKTLKELLLNKNLNQLQPDVTKDKERFSWEKINTEYLKLI